MMTIEEILIQRQTTHGIFSDHAETAQKLKEVCMISQNWGCLTYDQREAIDMICHKLARILAGSHKHKDHWDDIAGYAMLISKDLKDV